MIELELQLRIPLRIPEHLEGAIINFNDIIMEDTYRSTPRTIEKEKYDCMPTQIKRKIKERRTHRKIWQTNRSSEAKTKLNRSIKDLKELLKEHKNNQI